MTNFNASSFRFFERKVAQGIALSDFSGSLLYHTKDYQGTTTAVAESIADALLYHTRNYQGTTTQSYNNLPQYTLYHTKSYQGTTTNALLELVPFSLYHTKNYNRRARTGPTRRNYTLQGSHGQNSRAAARQFLCCFFRPKWV